MGDATNGQAGSPAPTRVAGLTIGRLAATTGVTPEAIRYYEREGIIPTATRVGAGKYRHYAEADAERLRFVRRSRELGFSLDEVRELLALASGQQDRPCGDVNRIARTHLAQVNAKLEQLTALRTELDRLVQDCDGEAPIANCTLLGALSGVDEVGTTTKS